MMVIEFGVGGGPVPAFAGYTEAHRGDDHIASIPANPNQCINFMCSCFHKSPMNSHEKCSHAFSGEWCMCVCDLIGVPLVSI